VSPERTVQYTGSLRWRAARSARARAASSSPPNDVAATKTIAMNSSASPPKMPYAK
jgi:hypothetical protein